MINRFHVFQSRCGIFRPANGTCENSLYRTLWVSGVLATAQFCTINPYVSFWIRLSHYAGHAHATVEMFQDLWRWQVKEQSKSSKTETLFLYDRRSNF
jgi:hypothetical protein